MMKLSIFLSVVLFAICASAYKTGAPQMACKALEPKHKDWVSQTSPSPYRFKVMKYKDYVDVIVEIINYKEVSSFKGFLIQAQNADHKPVGKWDKTEKAKQLQCDNENVSSILVLEFCNSFIDEH